MMLFHGHTMAAKIVIGLLSGSMLSSLWIPVLLQAPPATETEFWKEAFQAFMTISVTAIALLTGLLYRSWDGRFKKLEAFADGYEKWGEKVAKRQSQTVELLGLMCLSMNPQDRKLEVQIAQLLHELRRDG